MIGWLKRTIDFLTTSISPIKTEARTMSNEYKRWRAQQDKIDELTEENEKLREILKYALPHADIDELVADWPSD